MIYPTRFAVLLTAAGAPIALALAMARPELWVAGVGWIALAGLLVLVDAALCASGRDLDVEIDSPALLYAGKTGEAAIAARFERGLRPRAVDIAVAGNEKLSLEPDRQSAAVVGGRARAAFAIRPRRRGLGRLESVWLRWRGPLGMVWRQRLARPDRGIPITPDLGAVREEAIRLFSRQASFGMKVQRDLGEGAEFHALRDFQIGMDRRSVDWKQSARHSKLLAKEHHTERYHQIVFAIDCGRTMSEPVGGQPRLDRAINAALLLAYVCLKMGDRAALFAFDSKVRAAGGAVTSVRGFTALLHLAAGIDYSAEETNFTLGLSTLAGRLERRSLIVIFTDFPDSISAELMIENVGPLLKRHMVLFVAMRDVELEALTRASPQTADDVSRAVTAGALLAERELVLQRLRRLGVSVIDAPLEALGPHLVNAYLDLKQRNAL